MKVGVIGSGGREHAICYYLSKSKIVDKVFCIPGNAGTEEIAENVHLDINVSYYVASHCTELHAFMPCNIVS